MANSPNGVFQPPHVLRAAGVRHRLGLGVTLVFAASAAAACTVLLTDDRLWDSLVTEDGPVENATSVALALASLLFVAAAHRHRQATGARVFYLAFSGLLFLAAMDEISWGQRILEVPSPRFFLEHNDQQEINIHNTLQQWLPLRTKHVVGAGMVLYGVVMPWLLHLGRLPGRFRAGYVVFPPRFLSPAIVIGALFMVDVPTGNEEEVGELLLSLCLCLFGGNEACRSERVPVR